MTDRVKQTENKLTMHRLHQDKRAYQKALCDFPVKISAVAMDMKSLIDVADNLQPGDKLDGLKERIEVYEKQITDTFIEMFGYHLKSVINMYVAAQHVLDSAFQTLPVGLIDQDFNPGRIILGQGIDKDQRFIREEDIINHGGDGDKIGLNIGLKRQKRRMQGDSGEYYGPDMVKEIGLCLNDLLKLEPIEAAKSIYKAVQKIEDENRQGIMYLFFWDMEAKAVVAEVERLLLDDDDLCECNNDACGWSGGTRERVSLGDIKDLCPVCGETTGLVPVPDE